MIRQRLRLSTSRLALIGRVVTALFACLLIWYGLMVVLLAFKAAPDTVNSISGYRTVFDYLAELTPADVSGGVTRAILAGAGLLAFLVFGYLALKEIPRPYLARSDLELDETERGRLDVEPRAVERAAEIAACRHEAVSSATSRYGTDDLVVDVTAHRARDLHTTLGDVQESVVGALSEHGLPSVPVHVNLVGFERRTRRELN